MSWLHPEGRPAFTTKSWPRTSDLAPVFGSNGDMASDAVRRSRQALSKRQRSWLLALHVASGVGWLGAAVCMLLISWTNSDPVQHYPVGLVMERIDRFVMIPLPLVAIATGIVLSWGTSWGFVRWYWVVVKQLATYSLTALAPFTVHEWIVQMTDLSRAGVAGAAYGSTQRLHVLASAVIVLTGTAIVAISVLKPWGRRRTAVRRASDDLLTGHRPQFKKP